MILLYHVGGINYSTIKRRSVMRNTHFYIVLISAKINNYFDREVRVNDIVKIKINTQILKKKNTKTRSLLTIS